MNCTLKYFLMMTTLMLMACSGTKTAPQVASESAPVAKEPVVNSRPAPRKTVEVPSTKEAPIMLYESWPLETTLDNANIIDVEYTWLDAIQSAKSTIDFSEFYTNEREGTALARVMDALKAATERGVRVRFIVDKKMYKEDNIPLTDKLAAMPGVELRIIDYGAIAGGVQHAKYFIVDGQTAYFGSQNFDWRSLQQISEMGARLALPELVDPLKEIFEIDWNLALDPTATAVAVKNKCPVRVETTYNGEKITVETVASPKDVLPCDAMWDLPKIIAMIDEAKTSVSFQLLDYQTANYDKTSFTELDEALQRAAARGVQVRMLVSDWSTASSQKMKDLKRLQQIDNIETKMLTVPEHSMGFVPFSRTIHSKFLVVDNDKAWLGTSNWSGDYFYHSRNVGIIVSGASFNADLTKSFDRYWNSGYVETVDPDKNYPKKKRS
ncbi:MAG: hypothetical protein IIY06_05380 [Proteobacteria bacterium]|nr:hypothetical protein [Pseudomonadota bacterium]